MMSKRAKKRDFLARKRRGYSQEIRHSSVRSCVCVSVRVCVCVCVCGMGGGGDVRRQSLPKIKTSEKNLVLLIGRHHYKPFTFKA